MHPFRLAASIRTFSAFFLFLFLSQTLSPALVVAQAPTSAEIPLPQNNEHPFRANAADTDIKTADADTFPITHNRKITGSFKLQEGSLSSQTQGRSEASSLSVSASSIQSESQLSLAAIPPAATSQGGEIP